MNVSDAMLGQRKLILSSVVIAALLGVVSMVTMPRQEDPRIPDHWGLVVTSFPGADAEKMERLVVDPIEEHLAEVEEIKLVNTTIRSGVAITLIELRFPLDDVTKAWDEVRRALDKAERQFPESAGKPILDDRLQDHESVVLAVTGSGDPLVLLDTAKALKKEFLAMPETARVKLIADPGEQVTIELDDSRLRRLGLDPLTLKGRLASRNLTVPGGSVKLGGKKVVLRLNDEFESVEDLASTPVVLPSGAGIPLRHLANVRRGPAEPASARMRFNGEAAVGLGIVPQKGINVVDFGDAVKAKLGELKKLPDGVRVETVMFQPSRVRARLVNLGSSLLLSVLTVAGVLLWFMGVRLGLVVASIVPLVALTTLAIYDWGGGILQQISIAAFVISLGMLVDNAIVVSESVQRHLDEGSRPNRAAVDAVKELALPLAAATGTTLAAFLPMLLAKGVSGTFTRALPVIIMLTLTVSYLFAILVTPLMSVMFLRKTLNRRGSWFSTLGAFLGALAMKRTSTVLVTALILVTLSLAGFKFVDRRFFPYADRNQLIVDMKLPEGAHLEAIDAAARRMESELAQRKDVVSVAGFIGRSTPQFYYNLPRLPEAPHLAQIVVTTVDLPSVERVLKWVRRFARTQLPEIQVVGRRLQQGPPLEAPFEVRLIGWDLEDVGTAANMVLASLKTIDDAVDVRQDQGLGVPTIRFRIDDAAAARHGLSRSDVALAVQGRTRGIEIGKYRAGEDPVPILIRSEAGEDYEVGELDSIHVARAGGKPVPLAQLATSQAEWLPAVIHHRNRKRVITVAAQLAEGSTYSRILNALEPKVEGMKFPQGIRLEYGGEAESSNESNSELMAAMPLGAAVLLIVLMVEFNSFRRVAIILVTIPLAASGVVPGLFISDQPFGFQSLLGVFALSGVVVNNAIVLVDRIDGRRLLGASVSEAVQEAVVARTRPILLTTATTVLGLLPLAFSGSSLWPPLAWSMISGLTASTGLTLLVVPSMYKLLFGREENGKVLEAEAC